MKLPEILALGLVLLVGIPFVYVLGAAVWEGHTRHREVPLRALIGSETFEALARGEVTPLHYMGRNRRVPDFTLRDRNGQPWRMKDHRGKTIVMNFWSIHCPPCLEELPSLEQLAAATEGTDVEVISVSIESGWDEVRTVFPRSPKMAVLFDPEGHLVRETFGTRLFPETWLIDQDGIIRLRVDGPRDWTAPIVLGSLHAL